MDITVTIHEIAVDGLPDMDNPDLVGRVALIFDGNVVSGWPLIPEHMDREGLDVHPDIRSHAAAGDTLWEGNTDVAHGRMMAGVTHWIEFPHPIWNLTGGPLQAADAA